MRCDRLLVVAVLAAIGAASAHATLLPGGHLGDGRTSLVYDANTGYIALDAPWTALFGRGETIESAAGILTGARPAILRGGSSAHTDFAVIVSPPDPPPKWCRDGRLFRSVPYLKSFGRVAQPGLTVEFLLSDLEVTGMLCDYSPLGDVDLVYLPASEPNGSALGDDRTSIIYDTTTGYLALDAPAGGSFGGGTNIDSVAGIFTGPKPPLLTRSFDNFAAQNIFLSFDEGCASFGLESYGPVAQPGLSKDFVSNDLTVRTVLCAGNLDPIDLVYIPQTELSSGDANQDLSFDQRDIVQVLQAGKYLTGEPATWGEGDWNGGPGGYPGEPPPGDGLFDQRDIVAALQTGRYMNRERLQAGDANQDGVCNQLDLVQVQIAAKFLTGQAATWGEGDWNGAPGGERGNPPRGDGYFDHLDIIAAFGSSPNCFTPLAPYAAISPGGVENDEQTSIIYDARTGEIALDAPASTELTSINIDSAACIFTGDPAMIFGSFGNDSDCNIFSARFGGDSFGSHSLGNIAQTGLSEGFVANDLTVVGSLAGGGDLGDVDLIYTQPAQALQPGDANRDLVFDQLDIVQVLQAGKYLTGEPATWGEGDWDGAPGGSPDNPPVGDGLFDQLDIIAALNCSHCYRPRWRPYAAIKPGGTKDDEQTSIIYDARTGEIAVDASVSTELTSINLDSAAGIFTGDPPKNIGGTFCDFDPDRNIFKATFGGSFGSVSFGDVAQPGLSEAFVANDLTVVGSLAGGGDLGPVDLVYIPEPSSLLLALLGIVGLLHWRR